MEIALDAAHTGQWFRGFIFSIRGKIILFACVIAFGAAYIIGNIYAVRMSQDMGIQRLVSQTRLLGPQFEIAFNEMRQDVLTLSHLPAFFSLHRGMQNNGIDPVDGTTLESLNRRLALTFVNLMQARPYYLQMRYIGVEDDGREVIRVNNTKDQGLAIVPPQDLQQKGRETYYQEALKTGLGDTDIYFSPVTLNREHHVVEIPHRAMIRAIRTVRDEAGDPIGMVLVNADYADLLRRTMAGILSHEEIYIINSEGDYMMKSADGVISPFHYRGDPQDSIPDIVKMIRPLKISETTFYTGTGDTRKVVHYLRLPFDKSDPTRFLGIAMATPQNELFEPSPIIQHDTLLLASVLAAIACVISLFIARLFIRPLQQINAEILAYTDGKKNLSLPTQMKDEIGTIARSFAGMTERLDKYYADLERSNRELDDFAYIASHDLKEPLRAISNHTTFLYEDHVAQMDDDAKNRIDRIKQLCERAEKLVSELLYFSRLGRSDLAQSDVDINDVINDIRTSLSTMLEESHATIRVNTPLPRIHCDSVRVISVFQNLIINGIKYNDSDPKIIEIGFLPRAAHDGAYIRNVFYVRDNGIGIAPEYHDHVFRLFKRLNSQHKYGEGTGAGLTFVKKIIERHLGKIWLESAPGKGSTFYFTLSMGESA